MAGGLLQLVSNIDAPQNRWITEDPEITFFKSIYRRHTPFACENYDVIFSIDFGKSQTVNLPTDCDLIHNVFISFDVPTLSAFFPNSKSNDIFNLTNTNDLLTENYNIDKNIQICTETIKQRTICYDAIMSASYKDDIQQIYFKNTPEYYPVYYLIKLMEKSPSLVVNTQDIINELFDVGIFWHIFENHYFYYDFMLKQNISVENANKRLNDNFDKYLTQNINKEQFLTVPNISENSFDAIINILKSVSTSTPVIIQKPFILSSSANIYINNDPVNLNNSYYPIVIDPSFKKQFITNIIEDIEPSEYLKLITHKLNFYFFNLSQSYDRLFELFRIPLFTTFIPPTKLYNFNIAGKFFDGQNFINNVFNANILYYKFFYSLTQIDKLIVATFTTSDISEQTYIIQLFSTINDTINQMMDKISFSHNKLFSDINSTTPTNIFQNYSSGGYIQTINNVNISTDILSVSFIFYRNIPSIIEIFNAIYKSINGTNEILNKKIKLFYQTIFQNFCTTYNSLNLEPEITFSNTDEFYNDLVNYLLNGQTFGIYTDTTKTLINVSQSMYFYFTAELIHYRETEKLYTDLLFNTNEVDNEVKQFIISQLNDISATNFDDYFELLFDNDAINYTTFNEDRVSTEYYNNNVQVYKLEHWIYNNAKKITYSYNQNEQFKMQKHSIFFAKNCVINNIIDAIICKQNDYVIQKDIYEKNYNNILQLFNITKNIKFVNSFEIVKLIMGSLTKIKFFEDENLISFLYCNNENNITLNDFEYEIYQFLISLLENSITINDVIDEINITLLSIQQIKQLNNNEITSFFQKIQPTIIAKEQLCSQIKNYINSGGNDNAKIAQMATQYKINYDDFYDYLEQEHDKINLDYYLIKYQLNHKCQTFKELISLEFPCITIFLKCINDDNLSLIYYGLLNDFVIPFINFNYEIETDNIYKYLINLLCQVHNNNYLNYVMNDIAKLNEKVLQLKFQKQQIIEIVTREKQAKCAWIHKLAHFLIEYVEFYANDTLICKHESDWFEVYHQIYDSSGKINGYNKMIGHVAELITFNETDKPQYTINMPLIFYFNNLPAYSLPINASINTQLKLKIKLRSFNDVAYCEKYAQYHEIPKITNSKLIVQKIFLTTSERNNFSQNAIEYLIDEIQMETNHVNYSNEVSIETHFKNCVKMISVLFKPLIHTDISLRNNTDDYFNGEKQWDNYGLFSRSDLSQITFTKKQQYDTILQKSYNTNQILLILNYLIDIETNKNIKDAMNAIKMGLLNKSDLIISHDNTYINLIEQILQLNIDFKITDFATLVDMIYDVGINANKIQIAINLRLMHTELNQKYISIDKNTFQIYLDVLNDVYDKNAIDGVYKKYNQSIVNGITDKYDIQTIYYLNMIVDDDLIKQIADQQKIISNQYIAQYAYIKNIIYGIIDMTNYNKLILQEIVQIICQKINNEINERINKTFINKINYEKLLVKKQNINPLISGYMTLNGSVIMPENTTFPVWSFVVPFKCLNRTPSIGINIYSWSLKPLDVQPMGTINHGRIANFMHTFNLNPLVSKKYPVVNVIIAYSYNVVRHIGGMIGKAW